MEQQLYQPQESKGYRGLKAVLWIAVAMLIHFVALLVAQLLVMVVFMIQDIASGAFLYTQSGEILYHGVPAISSDTTAMLTGEFASRYIYESTSYATIFALPLVLLGLWICNLIQKTKVKDSVPYRKFSVVPNLLAFVVGLSVCVLVSFIVSYTFIKDLSPEINVTTELVFASSPLWLLILSTAIAAPIMEECTFRGFVYTKLQTGLEPSLGKYGYLVTIVLQALLFGAFHMNLQQFIYASALGLLLGWMRYYTNSVWPGIFTHIGFNFFSVGLYGLLQQQENWAFAKWVAGMSDLHLLLLALPVFAVSLFLFVFTAKKQGKHAGKTSQNQ